MLNLLLFFILCGVGFAWLSPNHIFPWLTSHSEFAIFFSLIGLGIYTLVLKKELIIQKQNLWLLLLAFIPLGQYLFGKIFFLGDAILSCLYVLAFLFAISLGNTLCRNIEDKRKILTLFSYVVVFCCLISLYIELLQWVLIHRHGILMAELPPEARPFANFAQPNTLATFLIIGIMSTIYLYENKILSKYVGVIFTFLLIFGITLTQSRTPWVYTLVFLIWWFWKANLIQLRTKTSGIVCGCIWYIVCLTLLPIFSNWLGVAVIEDAYSRASSGFARLNMWQQMLVAIKNEPWFGYGWNQVSVAQVQNTLEFSHYEWTEHAHNLILDLIIWNGIPVGALILFILICWLVRFITLANTKENFLILSMIGAVLVHAMLEFPLEYAFFLLPVGFLFGLVQSDKQNANYFSIPLLGFTCIIVISISLYGWIWQEYRTIEGDAELARFEALNIGTLHAENKAPDIIILTQLREQIGLMRTQPKANMSNNEIDGIRKIAYRHASSPALYRYSQVLALNGCKMEAKKHLLILEKLHGKKYSVESLLQVNKSLAFEWQNKSISKL
ncbi:MAG: Wzy polymerase domain-containing protein [Bacteroidales bacterium]